MLYALAKNILVRKEVGFIACSSTLGKHLIVLIMINNALERKGVDASFLKVWKSLYSKLKSCVKIDEYLTEFFFKYTIGTRHVRFGSPKIFSLFINDLISYLEKKFYRGLFVTTEIPDVLGLMFADEFLVLQIALLTFSVLLMNKNYFVNL